MTYAPLRHPRNGGRALLLVGLFVLGNLLDVGSGLAQSEAADTTLVERYRSARLEMVARRLLGAAGTIQGLPPVRIPTAVDSLRLEPQQTEADESTYAFPLEHVRTVRRGERDWFRDRFAETKWSFLGSSTRHAFFDTTRTPELRARLQTQFGPPTQTLSDIAPGRREETIDSTAASRPQFEYWFVVNDSIPVRVTDARGPRGRGLIVTTDRRLRDQLVILRRALLTPLRQSARAPYVDYYYDRSLQRWYRSGYDGHSFFLEPFSRSEFVPGQRPQLDAAQSPSASSPEESPSSGP